jgi:hypothetical protein
MTIPYNSSVRTKAPAVVQHPEAQTKGRSPMVERIVPQERLLYASYSPPHVYEDGTDDGQPVVTALFQEPTERGEVGYAIREYSLAKGDIFYRFPKRSGGHWSRAVIRQEWYRETETRLPDSVFEVEGSAS